jgi:precorrin-3B methylase
VVVPGVSAINACAALLGAPIAHDFAVLSLSDLLTPWSLIEKRLSAAAQAVACGPDVPPEAVSVAATPSHQ